MDIQEQDHQSSAKKPLSYVKEQDMKNILHQSLGKVVAHINRRGQYRNSRGTGLLVSPSYILTSRHVIYFKTGVSQTNQHQKYERAQSVTYYHSLHNQTYILRQVANIDEIKKQIKREGKQFPIKQDYVFLKLNEPIMQKEYLQLEVFQQKEKEKYIFGLFALFGYASQHNYYEGVFGQQLHERQVGKTEQCDIILKQDYFFHNLETRHGLSGAPFLYLAQNKIIVIGINKGTSEHKDKKKPCARRITLEVMKQYKSLIRNQKYPLQGYEINRPKKYNHQHQINQRIFLLKKVKKYYKKQENMNRPSGMVSQSLQQKQLQVLEIEKQSYLQIVNELKKKRESQNSLQEYSKMYLSVKEVNYKLERVFQHYIVAEPFSNQASYYFFIQKYLCELIQGLFIIIQLVNQISFRFLCKFGYKLDKICEIANQLEKYQINYTFSRTLIKSFIKILFDIVPVDQQSIVSKTIYLQKSQRNRDYERLNLSSKSDRINSMKNKV